MLCMMNIEGASAIRACLLLSACTMFEVCPSHSYQPLWVRRQTGHTPKENAMKTCLIYKFKTILYILAWAQSFFFVFLQS